MNSLKAWAMKGPDGEIVLVSINPFRLEQIPPEHSCVPVAITELGKPVEGAVGETCSQCHAPVKVTRFPDGSGFISYAPKNDKLSFDNNGRISVDVDKLVASPKFQQALKDCESIRTAPPAGQTAAGKEYCKVGTHQWKFDDDGDNTCNICGAWKVVGNTTIDSEHDNIYGHGSPVMVEAVGALSAIEPIVSREKTTYSDEVNHSSFDKRKYTLADARADARTAKHHLQKLIEIVDPSTPTAQNAAKDEGRDDCRELLQEVRDWAHSDGWSFERVNNMWERVDAFLAQPVRFRGHAIISLTARPKRAEGEEGE